MSRPVEWVLFTLLFREPPVFVLPILLCIIRARPAPVIAGWMSLPSKVSVVLRRFGPRAPSTAWRNCGPERPPRSPVRPVVD
jgi:hypothetical protein